jgi:hypothetical protein
MVGGLKWVVAEALLSVQQYRIDSCCLWITACIGEETAKGSSWKEPYL